MTLLATFAAHPFDWFTHFFLPFPFWPLLFLCSCALVGPFVLFFSFVRLGGQVGEWVRKKNAENP